MTTNIKEFAIRVERLCDFFISKYREEQTRDGSPNLRIIEDLKDQASEIQHGFTDTVDITLEGLDNYMRGLTVPPKEPS